MKKYTQKPVTISAVKIDFTSWDSIRELYDFLEKYDFAIVHNSCNKFPTLSYDGNFYSQGDYIVMDEFLNVYGVRGESFEEQWVEQH